MLEPLGNLRGHTVLAVYQGIWNYFNILLATRTITPLGIGLILAAYVLIFSMNRKSYVKMARR